MTLSQVRKLATGDTFRRPSTNGHDNGWRCYTVLSIHNELFNNIAVVDQHGYSQILSTRDKDNREWFKQAEVTR